MNEVCTIPLSRGLVAHVDAEDFDWLNQWKWSALKSQGNGAKVAKFYAVRTEVVEGKQRTILMHRVLTGAKRGQVVDHQDGDTLNNRRGNLRACTTTQNSLNCGPHRRDMTSAYKGVYKHTQNGKWAVRFRGKYVGIFDGEVAAARAYDAAAKAFDPEFAFTNFPVGEVA